ncbi:MAG TPA: hypothetical protein VNA87_06460 [Actinomycetota bacterium]|nr:hypothetical protein [Actinomycetota bacterium]
MDPVQVSLEAYAPADEMAAVVAAFAEAGIPAEVTTNFEWKGAGGDYPWLVVITAPVLATFLAEATKDAYKALAKLVVRIYEARKASSRPNGSLTLVDGSTGTWIALPPDLPDEAWKLLPEAQLTELPTGALRWDSETLQWRAAGA